MTPDAHFIQKGSFIMYILKLLLPQPSSARAVYILKVGKAMDAKGCRGVGSFI